MLAQTARHSAIYALGVLLNRAAGFLMLPLYTRYLTPADYGAVEMLFVFMRALPPRRRDARWSPPPRCCSSASTPSPR
jgi:hypothetical protein